MREEPERATTMPDDTRSEREESSRKAIKALIAVHIVAAVVLALLSAQTGPSFRFGLLTALLFSQITLLGTWLGFGSPYWPWKLGVVTLIMPYSVLAFFLSGYPLFIEVGMVVSAPTFLLAGIAWLVRRSKLAVLPLGVSVKPQKLQFSIRYLMILTLAVALLTAFGTFVAPRMFDIMTVSVFLGGVLTLTVCFAMLAMSSLWAWLGTGNPIFRSAIVVIVATGNGTVVNSLVASGNDLFMFFVMCGQGALVCGTLAAIRRCGFRLVAVQRR